MSGDYEATHIKEMRNYIAISANEVSQQIIREYSGDNISPVLLRTKQVVEGLEHIGLEKLALLFGDRSHAEIILENCQVFNKKVLEGDTRTAEIITEAFSKIFEKIERERFLLIGLTEGQINVLTGNVQILSESFKPIVIKENDTIILDELLEKMRELCLKWESHRENDYTPEDFREGVEIGLMRASQELQELYNAYKITKDTGGH